MKKGLFITFEGIDGCGKSTQIEYFKELLTDAGVPFICVREPGGTPISESIRTLLLDKRNTEMLDETEALLFAAARTQLVSEVILPALKEGRLVLSDRFYDSSVAYQGTARGLGEAFVRSINSYATQHCRPDCTLFFDISPDKVRERISSRGEADRLEGEGAAFHERVYRGYLDIIAKEPERFMRIDASGSVEEVNAHVKRAFEEILKRW